VWRLRWKQVPPCWSKSELVHRSKAQEAQWLELSFREGEAGMEAQEREHGPEYTRPWQRLWVLVKE